jgi:transcriptional regulator with XRE-family HTH domain
MNLLHTETVCLAQAKYTETAVPSLISYGHDIPVGYAETLKELRKEAGLTQADLAERLGVEQPTVQRWEGGRREPSLSTLEQIARVLGVSPSAFFSDAAGVPLGPQLFVKGSVAAGVWQEATEWPESEWQSFIGRHDVIADFEHRFGLRIDGESMNEIYPPGTIVECVSVFGRAEVKSGKRVIVIRENDQHEFEATVKEYIEDDDGRAWAVPRSRSPAFQPICLDEPEDGITETRIAAIVVASIRPE